MGRRDACWEQLAVGSLCGNGEDWARDCFAGRRPERTLLLMGGVGQILCIVHGAAVVTVLIERCVWMGDDLVVLRRMLRFEQFLQADDAAQQQRQFTDDQGLEGDQCQEAEHQWQQGGRLQLEQQQQWQQEFLGLFALTTSCIACNFDVRDQTYPRSQRRRTNGQGREMNENRERNETEKKLIIRLNGKSGCKCLKWFISILCKANAMSVSSSV